MQSLARAFRAAADRPTPWLAGIFVAGLAIRLAALFVTQPTQPAGDELELFVRAARLVVGPPLEDEGLRAPGILFFYAGVFRLFEAWALLAKAANVVVSSLTVLPIFFIGRAYGGVRVGLLAAVLAALYPTFIAFSHYLWSEPLYIFVMSCGVATAVWAIERPVWWRFAAAGALLGASALCKESGLVFPPLAALFLLCSGRSRVAAARAGALAAGAALVILPWTVHINEPDLPFAVITRTTYMNLYVGNHPRSPGHGMQEFGQLAPTHLEAERAAREIALAQISARLPWWPLEKIASELPRFFTPTSFAVRRLLMPAGDPGNWGYRFRWPAADRMALRRAAVAIVVASYLVIVTAGMAGLLLARRRDLSGFFLLFVASQILPSIITFSMSRFRLPSMVFFILGAASLTVYGRARLVRGLGCTALSGRCVRLVDSALHRPRLLVGARVDRPVGMRGRARCQSRGGGQAALALVLCAGLGVVHGCSESVDPVPSEVYGVQLHLHGSMSEGAGSMEGHNLAAAELGGAVDVIWWTDHDWRIAAHTYVTGFDFETGLEAREPAPRPLRTVHWDGREPEPGWAGHRFAPSVESPPESIEWVHKAWIRQKVARPARRARLELSDSEARDGQQSLHVVASATGEAWETVRLGFETTRRRHVASLASGVRLRLAVLPVRLEGDARLVLGVQLSQHPPGHRGATRLHALGRGRGGALASRLGGGDRSGRHPGRGRAGAGRAAEYAGSLERPGAGHYRRCRGVRTGRRRQLDGGGHAGSGGA